MTARISINDRRLAIHRAGAGRWFGPSVDVPLAHVESVAPLDPAEAKRRFKGIRLAGIEIPGLIVSGLFRHEGKLTWWDVGRGSEILAITLRDERLAKLVVEVEDPAAVRRALNEAIASVTVPNDPLSEHAGSRAPRQ
jgi:hypothetical protein